MPMHTDNSPAYGRLYGSAFEGVKQYCRGSSLNVRYVPMAIRISRCQGVAVPTHELAERIAFCT